MISRLRKITVCRRAKRLLSDSLDEPLPAGQESFVRKHLETCAECRAEARFYREIKEAAQSVDSQPVPGYVWERILLEVEEHSWGGETAEAEGAAKFWKKVSPVWRVNLGGAALCFLIISILSLLPMANTDKDASPSSDTAIAQDIDNRSVEFVTLYMLSRGDDFPPEVRDYFISRLTALNERIRTIKSALAQFPGNRDVLSQLALAYRGKLDLYREIGLGLPAERIIQGLENSHFHMDRGGMHE